MLGAETGQFRASPAQLEFYDLTVGVKDSALRSRNRLIGYFRARTVEGTEAYKASFR